MSFIKTDVSRNLNLTFNFYDVVISFTFCFNLLITILFLTYNLSKIFILEIIVFLYQKSEIRIAQKVLLFLNY